MPLQPKLITPGSLRLVALHRISLSTYHKKQNPDPIPDDMLTGEELEIRFRNKALGTGGRVGYSILIRTDATVEQMLPLLVRGAHAKNHNWCSWSVAVVGNYDEREMPDRIWKVAVDVLSVLAAGTYTRQVMGHTELPHSSGDPNKRCPGRFVNMDAIRAEVAKRLPAGLETWDIRQRLAFVTGAGFAL
jgi:hypothetical protein